MSFARFLIVTALITMLGGLFGACVGGLLGFAVPSSLSVFFGSESHGGDAFKNPADVHSDPVGKKVAVGVDTQRNLLGQGAAIGGAFGLVFGALLGFLLGIVDQILHLVRGLINSRKDGAHPAITSGK